MNTRVAVPLTKEAYDAISLISEISGTSRGRILAETVEAAIPSFIAIADAYRIAMKLDVEKRASYLEGMKMAEIALLKVVEQVHRDFDEKYSSAASVPSPEGEDGAGVDDVTPDILTGGFPTPRQE